MIKAILEIISGNDSQTIDLLPSRAESSIVDTVSHTPYRVYQDKEYKVKFEFDDPSSISSYYLTMNDELVNISMSPDGYLQLSSDNDCVFSQCYGFVRFQIIYISNGTRGVLESPFITVMVKKGIDNDSVKRMTEYIYRYNSMLLSNKRNTNKYEKNSGIGNNKTIEAKLALLDRIIGVLEVNYSYFRINSRFKTVHVERIDYFDKLQFVSSATIQYIAQHPNELKRTVANTGIVIGGHRYQPERTLITQNAISYDTSENRAIMSFIERLAYDVQCLKKAIQSLIDKNSYDSYEEDEYISSAYYVYLSTLEVLNKMKVQVDSYDKRIVAVQLAYSKIFNIKTQRLVRMPIPTAIFMSVPQYKQLYDCMNEWLKSADIGLELQKQILGLKMMSEIYELYILLKLVRYFSVVGYDLISADHIVYQFTHKNLYKQTSCNNRYIFGKGEETIILYYQPVLYSGVNDPDYGIGLYRNNTVPYSVGEALYKGEYYTPDYVIKYKNPNLPGARFFVLDAKYSTRDNVLRHQLSSLVYKYLFSISTIDLNDKIIGLYIVNGRSNRKEDSVSNIYDRSRNEGMIMPRAEVITLTENAIDNLGKHELLLTRSIGRFL
ncbi:MAG: DUF2357 domain-containing protein [Clostridiales bacterium]|nr:DUF2357 domain-containing protein [Clostridiales bacterium]